MEETLAAVCARDGRLRLRDQRSDAWEYGIYRPRHVSAAPLWLFCWPLDLIGTGEATAAPGALWTTPLSAAGSIVYGSPTGGFLLDLWDGTSLDPVVGTASDAQVALGDHDAGVAPAFDSAGDVYRWSSTTGSTEQFALEKDSPSGQVLWRTPVNAEQPHDLVLGSNHDLYASYFSNEDGWHLLRLDTSTGQVLWNDAGPEGVPEPTPEGVALVSAGQVQLVGSDESSGGAITYAAGNTRRVVLRRPQRPGRHSRIEPAAMGKPKLWVYRWPGDRN